MRRSLAVAVAAAAPVLLAVAGVLHPPRLTDESAPHWVAMHVALLPVFPLLALGFVVPVAGRPSRDLAGVATVVGWVAAFAYAAFYTGLDAVAGIGAGTVRANAEDDPSALIAELYDIGNALGQIGAYACAVATVAITVPLVLRHGPLVLPGTAILLVASISFVDSHIFWPRGVLTMVGFAVGFALWAAVAAGESRAVGGRRAGSLQPSRS